MPSCLALQLDHLGKQLARLYDHLRDLGLSLSDVQGLIPVVHSFSELASRAPCATLVHIIDPLSLVSTIRTGEQPEGRVEADDQEEEKSEHPTQAMGGALRSPPYGELLAGRSRRALMPTSW
jgi:hypothetical protein